MESPLPPAHPEQIGTRSPDAATDPATDGAPAVLRIGALIRARRRQAGMTLQSLCAVAGLSVGYLSQIERDQATPSLATLTQVARALGVGVEYFIAAPKVQDALSRSAGRARFSINGSSILYEQLSTEFPGSELSSYILHVPPGYRSEVVSHDGEECLYLLEGEITQWLGSEKMVLCAGDALHFRGNVDHAWANRTDRPARMLWTGKLTLFQPPRAAPALPETVAASFATTAPETVPDTLKSGARPGAGRKTAIQPDPIINTNKETRK